MDKIKFLKPLEVESLVVTKAIEGTGGTDAAISAHNSNTSAHADIREEISQLSAKKVNKTSLTLGVHSDGLVYIFVDGSPVGDGIDLATVGDLIGYVDENNNIIVQGNLADGTYSVKYEMENGSTVNIGNLVLDSNVYYSVTKNLTKCSISNSATRVVEGESYSATITANSDYALKSVTVTMGGSPVSVSGGNISIASVTGDIVITAVAEEIPAATYTITNNLTNCKNSNSATTIEEGSAYSATITANSGYTLDSVSATMGGAAVTVTDGKINIASVTGNIVITATAKAASGVEPTDFVEYNATNTTDWSIWINNARAGSDGTYRSDTVSTEYGTPVVTNYVAVQNGDIVEFGGIHWSAKNSVVYNSSKGILQSGILKNLTSYISDVATDDNYNDSFTVISADVAYIRIGGYIHTAYGSPYIKIKRNGEYL